MQNLKIKEVKKNQLNSQTFSNIFTKTSTSKKDFRNSSKHNNKIIQIKQIKNLINKPKKVEVFFDNENCLIRLRSLLTKAYKCWEIGNMRMVDSLFQESLSLLYRNACSNQNEKKPQLLFEMAKVLHNRGLIARKNSVYLYARKNFSRVFFVYLKLAINKPEVFLILTSLAQLDISENKNDYSAKLFGKVLEVYSKFLSKNSWIIFSTYIDLFLLHCKRQQWDLAALFAEKAIEFYSDNPTADKQQLFRIKVELSLIYEKMNRFDRAYTLKIETLKTLEQKYGKKHPNVLAHLMSIAKMLENNREFDKAEKIFKLCENNYVINGGKNSIPATFAKCALATLYIASGKVDEAFIQLSQCLNARKISLGVKHPLVAETNLNLGILEWSRCRFAKAEIHVLTAYRIYLSILNPEHELCLYAYRMLNKIKRKCVVCISKPF